MKSASGIQDAFAVAELTFRISLQESVWPRCGHRPSWDVRDADTEEDLTDFMAAGLAECQTCGACWMQGCP